jgi:hypothetical protein
MVLVRFNKDRKKWDIIDRADKQEGDMYLDGKLKEKLDFAKEQKRKDNDVVGIMVGEEGSGKSNCAANIMRYMADDSFDPIKDMIGSDEKDALDKLKNVKHGGNLMFDEGNVFFLSTETMKKQHRNLHKIFSIFRQKNLFVLIVLPSFFRLGTYFALDRSRFLCRTYLDKGERGYFSYWGDKAKNKLYRRGKKDHSYSPVKANFNGRFTKCDALDTKEYKDFKLETLNSVFFVPEDVKKVTRASVKTDIMNDFIARNIDVPTKDLSRLLGKGERWIQQLRKKIIEDKQSEENQKLANLVSK